MTLQPTDRNPSASKYTATNNTTGALLEALSQAQQKLKGTPAPWRIADAHMTASGSKTRTTKHSNSLCCLGRDPGLGQMVGYRVDSLNARLPVSHFQSIRAGVADQRVVQWVFEWCIVTMGQSLLESLQQCCEYILCTARISCTLTCYSEGTLL